MQNSLDSEILYEKRKIVFRDGARPGDQPVGDMASIEDDEVALGVAW